MVDFTRVHELESNNNCIQIKSTNKAIYVKEREVFTILGNFLENNYHEITHFV